MSGCKGDFTCYDAEGHVLDRMHLSLPDWLDWMEIDVKAFWFRTVGHGPEATKYVLFQSQGEQRLLIDVTLRHLDHLTHKENYDGDAIRKQVEAFIDEGGYSKKPRNQ